MAIAHRLGCARHLDFTAPQKQVPVCLSAMSSLPFGGEGSLAPDITARAVFSARESI